VTLENIYVRWKMTVVSSNTKFLAVFLGNIGLFEFQFGYSVFNCCCSLKTPVLEPNVRTLASSVVFLFTPRLIPFV
jgi:hypothetical protein